jgi:hypothetical protein
MKYTEQDVRDAYLAHFCMMVATAEGTTPEEAAVYGIEFYGDDNKLDQEATDKARAAQIAQLQRGQEILEQARLVFGRRYRRGTGNSDPLISDDAPTVRFDSGHIANQEAVVEVTLASYLSYLTCSEAATATGTSSSSWRNRAAAGDIPGAVKRGKTWLIPRDIIRK